MSAAAVTAKAPEKVSLYTIEQHSTKKAGTLWHFQRNDVWRKKWKYFDNLNTFWCFLQVSGDPDLDDLYSRYKRLQQQLEFVGVQEEYIKDEQRNLKKEYVHAQEEVKRIQSVPLVIGQFLEAVDQNTGIVGKLAWKFLRLRRIL